MFAVRGPQTSTLPGFSTKRQVLRRFFDVSAIALEYLNCYCERLRPFPSMTVCAPSAPETACRRESGCVFHHSTELPQRRRFRSGGNRRGAWNTPERPESPDQRRRRRLSLVQDKVTIRLRLWPRDELETALGELIVSRSGLMAARTTVREPLRGRTAISMLLWSELKRA